ncbi:TetR family transcriptional regulator, partial [Burkholderia gladioli]|nr:TetR family transcriptional regulator [Burkholderia gladioli]
PARCRRAAPPPRAPGPPPAGTLDRFMLEVLPGASPATLQLAGEMIGATLRLVGKQFSECPRTPAEIETHARAMSDMFCAYLRELARP